MVLPASAASPPVPRPRPRPFVGAHGDPPPERPLYECNRAQTISKLLSAERQCPISCPQSARVSRIAYNEAKAAC